MNKLFKFYIDYKIKQTLKNKKYQHLKNLHFVSIYYKNFSTIITLQFAYLNENDFSDIKTKCNKVCDGCDCNKFKWLMIKIF